jgi:glycosyltransferase involved in cell wall biosynthesis
MPDKQRILKVSMLVVDANDAGGSSNRDTTRIGPVLHPAVDNLLEGLSHRDDVQIDVLYGRQNPTPEESRENGAVRYIPVPYKKIPIPGMGGAYAGRTFALLKEVKRRSPDLVHAQGTERESGLVAALAGFPSILTLHGNLTEIAKSMGASPFSYFGLASRLERFALGRVSGVHCISKHTQTSVAGKSCRTWIIPNAVANDYFGIVNRPSANPSVVCISGIAEWKNPLALVKASGQLHNEFPDATVDFYGACDITSPYGKAFLDALTTREWCHFHGQSSKSTMIEALETASCSVLPSLMENCPVSILESMAAGVVVLGANVGGIPDLIESKRTGLLFDPRDNQELGNLLVTIHRDRENMALFARAGRADAAKRFSIQAVTEAHIEMYRSLLISKQSDE